MKKYLVVMCCILNNTIEPIIICDTKEKAQEWIGSTMNGYEYNGTGYYKIFEVDYIK